MVALRQLSGGNSRDGRWVDSFVAIAGGDHLTTSGARNIMAMRAATCGKRAQAEGLRTYNSCSGATCLSFVRARA